MRSCCRSATSLCPTSLKSTRTASCCMHAATPQCRASSERREKRILNHQNGQDLSMTSICSPNNQQCISKPTRCSSPALKSLIPQHHLWGARCWRHRPEVPSCSHLVSVSPRNKTSIVARMPHYQSNLLLYVSFTSKNALSKSQAFTCCCNFTDYFLPLLFATNIIHDQILNLPAQFFL